jgi:hypothetical protein
MTEDWIVDTHLFNIPTRGCPGEHRWIVSCTMIDGCPMFVVANVRRGVGSDQRERFSERIIEKDRGCPMCMALMGQRSRAPAPSQALIL